MTEETFSLDELLGSMRIVDTRKDTPTGWLLGGYAIVYDRFGNEIRRTENRWNFEVTTR